VLLAAPTGYGKTCLLSEWSQVDERPFAWVTLEAADNELEHLVSRISRAIAGTETTHSRAARPARRRSRADEGDLAALTALLTVRQKPFVLVLDDAHLLRRSAVVGAIRALAGGLPMGAQLALASRTQPVMRLGRLRARHELLELDARDLVMTDSEATMLLAAAGLSLDPEHVATLVRRTEGWPAALYLSALSLRDEADAATAVEGFAGDDGVLSDYLREELIDGISPETELLLRRTSIVDRLSGSLCDALLGSGDSAVLLERLARRDLLLEPLERTEESYRCHGLLREMLARELRRRDPDGARELHRRASSWHAARGETDRAIAHAVEAHDAAQAGLLLWTNLPRYADRARRELVDDWLSSFTEEELGRSAALSLVAAQHHLSGGDSARAEHWAAAAAAALAESDLPEAGSLRAGVLLIESVVARHGIARMGEDAARAFELEAASSPWRAVSRLYEGVAAQLTGDRLRAAALLDDGLHRSAQLPAVESLCQAQLAMMALAEEDWDLALDRSVSATVLVERHDLAEAPSAALVFAVAALVRAHVAEADLAEELVRRATRLLRRSDRYAPWYGAETRIMLARAALRLTDVRRARTLLAEASSAVRRVPDAPVLSGWLDVALGELDSGAVAELDGSSLLTLAELRILRFLPTHLSFREIGDRLHVSTNTVKSQAHAVYRKLDASSRSEAVARASRVGLIWGTISTDV
jgi:LuxR family maltose regulon positive regulatory protein